MADTPAPDDIVMLVYPGLTALDLIGPQTVLGAMPGARTHLVWKSLEPIEDTRGVRLVPSATFETAPRNPAIVFVPGGVMGTLALLEDQAVLDYLREVSRQARYITSVCTGALVLGAAGLLRGYDATTHWSTLDLLADFGANPKRQRVVVDRNRVTGGGVTAGIDFGLTLAAEIHGETVAKAIQLQIEYDPEPPFHSGTPASADPAITRMVSDRLSAFTAAAKQVTGKAGASV